jgi:hypothetical protein
VSNNLAESKNQTESERQSNVSEFNEVNKEINNLAVNIQDGPPTGTQSAVGQDQLAMIQNLGHSKNSVTCGNSNNTCQEGLHGEQACKNITSCNSVSLPSVSRSNFVYINSEMLESCAVLNKLTILTLRNNSKQIDIIFRDTHHWHER